MIRRTTPVESLPEFLTPTEFQTYLGIGRSTCYELLRQGLVPSVKFGRLIRIPKSALHSPAAVGTTHPQEPSWHNDSDTPRVGQNEVQKDRRQAVGD